ncbi:MAG TPA: CoA pyrophosphatase [Candidatus Aminicenantes bacterium]|nr:CoA pyrophosphatase [Candidatus Aminicenantes bacterium]
MEWKTKASLIKRAVNSTRPGLQSQLTMVTDPRPGHKTYAEMKNNCKKAGVLVLCFPQKSAFCLVLTRRTDEVKYHPNQISLPGGQCEPEESPLDAALRETHEELGIAPKKIRVLGQLTPLYIPPSNYCVYPAVAIMDHPPAYNPRSKEVAEVIEVPLTHLLDDKNILKEIWPLHGRNVSVPFYLYEKHKIWGATAMILAEFLDIIRPILKNQLA